MAIKTDPLVSSFRQMMQTLQTRPDEEILVAAMQSPAIHFALFCTIKNDDNEETRPEPNILQLRMNEAYETLRGMGIRVRIIVTKPRRAGCSSFVEHIGYHTAMRTPIDGITISDNKTHSLEAMLKLQSYGSDDFYPWGVTQVQDSTHSIAWSNGSRWTVDTAQNPDAGAGGTYQFAHCSETSKWPQTTAINDQKTMTCLAPAVSGRQTVMFSESTPEGARGWQYETWSRESMTLESFLKRWDEGFRPEEVWIRVFAAWYEFESNRRLQPCSEIEIQHLKDTLTDHEIDEIEKYDLDWEQIAWRRDTIKTKCGGDPKVFSYYYPSDPETCWLSSGSPRFDMEKVVKMELAALQSTPESGYLVSQDNKSVTFVPQHDGTGDILIWERPKPGLRYLIAADTAEAKSQTIGASVDANSVSVWRAPYHDTLTNRWMRFKKVARIRPPFRGEEEEVAAHITRLSRYYGNCIVAQETNKGFHCLRLLQNAGVPLYKRKPISHRTGVIEEQIGFRTDAQNREAIISAFATAIANEDIEVFCRHSIAEYKSFIRNAKGKSEAASGKHDDDVMCDAIAYETMPSATLYSVDRAVHRDPRDRGPNGWRASSGKW